MLGGSTVLGDGMLGEATGESQRERLKKQQMSYPVRLGERKALLCLSRG